MYRDLISCTAYTQRYSDGALYDSIPSPEESAMPGPGAGLNYCDRNEPVATRNSTDRNRCVAVGSCGEKGMLWVGEFDIKPRMTGTQCRVYTYGTTYSGRTDRFIMTRPFRYSLVHTIYIDVSM